LGRRAAAAAVLAAPVFALAAFVAMCRCFWRGPAVRCTEAQLLIAIQQKGVNFGVTGFRAEDVASGAIPLFIFTFKNGDPEGFVEKYGHFSLHLISIPWGSPANPPGEQKQPL
jgi:hypothetical protein